VPPNEGVQADEYQWSLYGVDRTLMNAKPLSSYLSGCCRHYLVR